MTKSKHTNPSWSEVYQYWQAKQVPLVEMIPFEQGEHYGIVPWFEKHVTPDERKAYYYFLSKGPLVGTAKNLLSDRLRSNPELYAAFAIFSTLIAVGERVSDLGSTVRDKLSLLNFNPWLHWHPTSVNVLPCNPEVRLLQRNPDWRLRIDAAAAVWMEICARFQVIKDTHLWLFPEPSEPTPLPA